MEAVYASIPLNTEKGELRLITILPKSSATERIECNIERVCFADTSLEYDGFLAALGSHSSNHAKILPAWYASRQPTPAETYVVHIPKFPDDTALRFRWGDFAALSYTWGDPKITQPILVNGCEAQVTTNLAYALEVLRSTCQFSGPFRLWVDALCIDQANNEERGPQVASMQRLYATAWSVASFLGPEADDSSKAIDLVEDLASYYGRQKECEKLRDRLMESHGHHEPGSWLALNQLTLRPYWERLWVIQEVSLGASRTLMFVGAKCIDWQRFCHGIEVLHLHLWIAKNKCAARDRKAINPADNRTWEMSGPLHRIWKDLWALSQPKKLESEPLTLSKLLEVANFSISYDPRDKVYGLLGMMPAKLAAEIIPDYAVDAGTVFTRTAMSYISLYKNLELLRDANVWGTTGAPTWAPDWAWNGRLRDSRPGAEEHKYLGQGLNEEARKPYGADKGLTFEGVRYQDSRLLCRGVIFDEVDGLGSHPPAMPNAVVQPKHQRSAYGDAEATAKALSRALYADRSYGAKDTQAIFHLPTTKNAARQAMKKLGWARFEQDLVEFYDRWTDWIRCNSALVVGGRPLATYLASEIPADASFADYWGAYQGWMRTTLGRHFATMASGRFGWVPFYRGGSNGDRSDVMAIFPGCTTPIVLRATEDCFQVVGEAYVHGMMEGEMADLVERGDYHMQDIWLC
jgi:hypothetical protein